MTAVRREAFDIVNISLRYGGVVKVLETGHAEDVTTKEQAVTGHAFLWFYETCQLLLQEQGQVHQHLPRHTPHWKVS